MLGSGGWGGERGIEGSELGMGVQIGLVSFWGKGHGQEGRHPSGCHQESYITAWGRDEQGLSQDIDGRGLDHTGPERSKLGV